MARFVLLLGLGFVVAGCDEYIEPPVDHPAPIAHDDVVTVNEDSTDELKVTALETNDENVRYGIHVEYSKPMHGTVGGAYVPDPGYFGPDSFTYTLKDEYGASSTGTVTVMVTSDGIPYESSTTLDTNPAYAIAAGDLDLDGKIDLVTADATASSVNVLVNRTVTPGEYKVERFAFEGGHEPVGVALADIDGDGRLDIISASRADGLVVLRNLTVAGGPLGFAGPIYLPARHAIAVAAADLNGDGLADLAAVDDYDHVLDVWINASTAGVTAFGPRTPFAAPRQPIQLVVDDADGDGSPDLAVLGKEVGQLSLFINATVIGGTTPAFGARIDRGTGTKPSGVILADLDADGDQEIAVLHDSEALWIYANNNPSAGAPSFEAARVIDLPTASHSAIAPVDLDGQGGLDIMMAVSGELPSQFLTNTSTQQGAYMFDAADARIGDPVLRKRVQYAEPSGIVFADLDGVPPLEIVVSAKAEFGNSGAAGAFVLFGR